MKMMIIRKAVLSLGNTHCAVVMNTVIEWAVNSVYTQGEWSVSTKFSRLHNLNFLFRLGAQRCYRRDCCKKIGWNTLQLAVSC